MSAAVEVEELGETCEICLGDMAKSDLINLPCKECNYNFCISCLIALLTSSKDDFEMASDGNMHVKVHLNCPNCRADISGTIEDTIKLRQKAIAEDLQTVADSDLSAKQLQQKYWKEDDGVKLQQKSSEDSGPEPLEIDPSLFGGLEFAMSDEEQKFVTKLMTSGCPGQLCQASQILAGTADMLRQGRVPAMQIAPSGSGDSARNGAPSSMRHGYSNAGLRTNRSHEEHDTAVTNFQRQMERKAREKLRRPLPARMPLCVSLGTGEFEQMALLARQRADPDREPDEPKSWWRCLIGRGTGVRGATMTFVDDEWDGTVADAFSRARIGVAAGDRANPRVQQRVGPKNPVEQIAVKKIISIGEREQRQRGLEPSQRCHRVLVGAVRGQAGKSGIMKGDVVTHVNGEVFTGTADELNSFLVNSFEQQGGDGTVTIVVNAEVCTAEALRLRSKIR